MRLLLVPPSILYGFLMLARRWLYRRGWWSSYASPIPVISVGNLTVGGTGKTPCVELIARLLSHQGARVAILSRGYGGYGGYDGRNDEALVLEENLPDVPHLQGIDRRQLLEIALDELESDVVILDDGFQHLRLSRSLDIVLIDATNPWGHGWVFPRGLLREPRGALKDADVVIITRSDQSTSKDVNDLQRWIHRRAPGATVCQAVHEPVEWVHHSGETLPLSRWSGATAAAFCGIGNPAAFHTTLARLGVCMAHWRVFPDHHAYSREDVEQLSSWAAGLPTDGIVLTTQKDLVKLRVPELGGRPLWALRVAFRVTEGYEALLERLRGAVDA
ncbi:MAG: tetraacyldisaccharide 4'-kinase [Gemmataceae bacterium]|nr:tetraacyldisaccharide 4'-kinase [Gemmataceae bacterium]